VLVDIKVDDVAFISLCPSYSVGKFLVTGAAVGPLLPSWMSLVQWRWDWFNWYSIWERK